MYINNLSLKNYRNIKNLNIEFSSGINIICGENAQGKTNILESIYLCSTGKSQRSSVTDKEIILFGSDSARVGAKIKGFRSDKIDILLSDSKKKKISVNGVEIKKLGELFGIINTVFFSPQDLNLIKAGPGERRRFMDMELCQINSAYYYNLKNYYRILKQRNNLLRQLQKDNKQADLLPIYDIQLAESGIILAEIRKSFIERLSCLAAVIHKKISNNRENLEIIYKNDINKDNFMEKLSKNHNRDIILGSTSHGIHKDDIIFMINGVNARVFGSQGQQRSVCLSAKMGEIELIKEEKKENPVLLLDDVMSELDKLRQRSLMDAIGDIQTIITCTGIEDSVKALSEKAKIFYVKEGKIL